LADPEKIWLKGAEGKLISIPSVLDMYYVMEM
jgi:hypothetical protein